MERTDSAAMMSLASMYADDSEGEEDTSMKDVDNISGSDDEGVQIKMPVQDNKVPVKRPLKPEVTEEYHKPPKVERKATRLVSYGPEEEEEEHMKDEETGSEDESAIGQLKEGIVTTFDASLNSELAASLTRSVRHLSQDDVKLPPSPPGKCSRKLQEKIASFYDKMHSRGLDLNESIQKRKDFRNPSIYEKLIQYCGIDEKGTNYPPEIYNPHLFGADSHYDELAKVQKIEMDKREKEKKDRTKIEFVVGTKKAASSDGSGEVKRKSKWDAQPQVMTGVKPAIITTTAINPPVVSITTSASGAKTTVISAVGTIAKKPKQ